MPNANPPTLTYADLQTKLDGAQSHAWCDYAFYIAGLSFMPGTTILASVKSCVYQARSFSVIESEPRFSTLPIISSKCGRLPLP